MTAAQDVCVIIAAKNAAGTIGRAIASALNENETSHVVVIDDASSDGTDAAARSADDGSGRLEIVRFDVNRGPAAARNHAISISRAPLIAILDADDFFFPGRFRQLLAEPDWDFIADNIAFVTEEAAPSAAQKLVRYAPHPRRLDLSGFIEGNISRRGAQRAEIGFLKPVMRRAFLDRHDLRYKEDLRLGEDYDLYARALARGAQYKVIHSCGYGAVVRSNSLSGSHKTQDLKRLYEADRAMLADPKLAPEAGKLIRRHERHIRGRYELRHFLDLKNQSGPAAALTYALSHPAALPAIVGGIFADKTARFRKSSTVAPAPRDGALRYLLTVPGASAPQK
ncbi:glycosyltransferase family 2 protein [Sinorhizobium sp. BG8]|uniref:glycosyltransferase family 2 protein n=1 Tax=Sinorhizobium sp. BG8 TaxID=2613773 RepID=UPI00193C9245|nr:glycosyltransferase family 2 protein [Sinorhizobium sp. BG8]QRM57350.1 glycosyltransferase family 2 protein [Sinorhizobium sp. BG8]